GVIVFGALVSLAVLAILYALVTRDFSLSLVANHTSRDLPIFPYTITALWSGQNGSLLFWSWILSLYGLVVVLKKWESDRDLMPYVISVLMLIQTFFAFLLAFITSPFEKMVEIPLDGAGLNPLLQHPAMAIHPPMLYLGYVGFTIPFCFAIAALLSGRLNDSWIRATRRWILIPWLFLGTGLLLGGRWAYDVLGWGGYWGWDPVENAALMPWLVGTAFLHSVMVQERKGMLKVWNIGLIIIAFSLVLFGTFLTRSGVVQSVHAFAESDIGPLFLGFTALIALASVALLFFRLDKLQSENDFDSLLSREVLFLVNNVLFLGAAIAILMGVMWPILSEVITGQTLTVGAPYYNLVVGSIFGCIVLLMGIIPLVGWGGATLAKLGRKMVVPLGITAGAVIVAFSVGARDSLPLLAVALLAFTFATTSADIVLSARARQKNTREGLPTAIVNLIGRNHRRYGGYLIHLSIVILAIGIIGSRAYATDEVRAMMQGESWETKGYTIVFEGLTPGVISGEAEITTASLGVFANGQRVATLHPGIAFYARQQQQETIPAIYHDEPFFRRDLYLIVQGWTDNFQTVSFRAFVNPLVSLVWLGGILFLISTLITMFPDPQERRVHVRVRQPVPSGALVPPAE
ncbi:MAG TPA: cytochrome c-type biogenesis CcmF C-terminal domain-containing protein, partial [Anaerolineae bacterium]|nr:cytochrome c-type biogenesis CcmF C-terminal domain-containing protein [Anaerolineae bacterium]